MTDEQNDVTQLLGPGGEPLGKESSDVSDGDLEASEPKASESTDEQSPVPQGPTFQVSAVLAVDPRVMPATLIAVLNHDPMEAYKRRLEAARPQFEQTKDVMIASAEAQLMSQAPEGADIHGTATRVIEQGFMSTLWDVCFETISGANVSIIYSAAMGGPDQVSATQLLSNQDVPTVWVATRALSIGDQHGVWAVPVSREQEMPVTVGLTAENFEQLRVNFAKVRV